MAVTISLDRADATILADYLSARGVGTVNVFQILERVGNSIKQQLDALNSVVTSQPAPLHFTEFEVVAMRNALDIYIERSSSKNAESADDKLMKYGNRLVRARLAAEQGAEYEEEPEVMVRRTRFTR